MSWLFLAIFGKNVENAFGPMRYPALYFAGGFVAKLTRTAMMLRFGTAADAQVAAARILTGAGRIVPLFRERCPGDTTAAEAGIFDLSPSGRAGAPSASDWRPRRGGRRTPVPIRRDSRRRRTGVGRG
jgi:hypothetical protein